MKFIPGVAAVAGVDREDFVLRGRPFRVRRGILRGNPLDLAADTAVTGFKVSCLFKNVGPTAL